MAHASSIDRLPCEARDRISALRANGLTIDEIITELSRLGLPALSRSALGRHIKLLDVRRRNLNIVSRMARELAAAVGHRPANLLYVQDRLALLLTDEQRLTPREIELAALVVLLMMPRVA